MRRAVAVVLAGLLVASGLTVASLQYVGTLPGANWMAVAIALAGSGATAGMVLSIVHAYSLESRGVPGRHPDSDR